MLWLWIKPFPSLQYVCIIEDIFLYAESSGKTRSTAFPDSVIEFEACLFNYNSFLRFTLIMFHCTTSRCTWEVYVRIVRSIVVQFPITRRRQTSKRVIYAFFILTHSLSDCFVGFFYLGQYDLSAFRISLDIKLVLLK